MTSLLEHASPELEPQQPSIHSLFESMGFDVNEAITNAVSGIATDEELALSDKVAQIEAIIEEGEANEEFREFVDFKALVAEMEMICTHDHSLEAAFGQSETISNFMTTHSETTQYGLEQQNPKGGEAKKKKDKKKTTKKSRMPFVTLSLN